MEKGNIPFLVVMSMSETGKTTREVARLNLPLQMEGNILGISSTVNLRVLVYSYFLMDLDTRDTFTWIISMVMVHTLMPMEIYTQVRRS